MRPPLDPDDLALVDQLARRAPSDNVPLLLELARRHAARRRPADLLAQAARDPFVTPSGLDQRLVHRLDGLALDAAEGFEAVLLSPLAPLGTCSTVSPTTQDRAVTTTRGTEVVSDPTNVLALLAATRLAAGEGRVRLCTVHQVVRPQRFGSKNGFSQHFRLFAMAEAGRGLPEHGFDIEAMVGQARVLLRLMDAAEALGCRFPDRRFHLLVAEGAAPIGDRLRSTLASAFPTVPLAEGVLASGYYAGVRLLIETTSRSGVRVPLGDIGRFDWAAKLTSDRRMRLVCSGIGLQLFPMLFGPPTGA